ncbi:MAG: UDP-3-O-[3-hydroxymyristoyl] N-acetylglucosamine deacetylase [Candidatus Eremiobacteraeota bacterium]|nr:UDP-3-O-[3-hydroxymyristoyl] N-acetylglucosamine deacetylase [Candidatus Eremiobacteraeota bacterium]
MKSLQYQATLRDALHFEGVGVHTGAPSSVDIVPASPGSGITFVLSEGTRVQASAEFVTETARATVLGRDGATVSTVEHLMAALFAMGVDNATVTVSGPEIPVMDGSAKAFAEKIAQSGVLSQNEIRNRLVITSPHFFREDDRLLVVLPASRLRVRFLADFAPPIGTQFFDAEITPEIFLNEIAAARTFGYLHEVEALRKRGLAQGGTLENAVVFGPDGPLKPLRWPDEVVRHKVLDLLGDLSLIGVYPQCEVIAIKSGHRLHCIATRELRKLIAPALPSVKVR